MANAKQELHEWAEVTKQNTDDIGRIQFDIETIKDNHLYHIEKDMALQTKNDGTWHIIKRKRNLRRNNENNPIQI